MGYIAIDLSNKFIVECFWEVYNALTVICSSSRDHDLLWGLLLTVMNDFTSYLIVPTFIELLGVAKDVLVLTSVRVRVLFTRDDRVRGPILDNAYIM